MQNLLQCSKQHCTVSRIPITSLFKYYSKKHKEMFKAMSTNMNFNNGVRRLCFPYIYRFYGKKHKELIGIQSLLSRNGFSKIYYLPKLYNARSFSTTSVTRQQSSDGSSRNSNKNHKRRDDFYMLFAKVLVVFLASSTLVTLYYSTPSIIVRISWNDFINEVLLKGQVKEIMIFPSYVEAQIKPNSTYKEGILSRKIIISDIPDIKDVEEKIRTVERNIGIRIGDGIPIRYINLNYINAVFEVVMSVLMLFLIIAFIRQPHIRNKFNILGDLRSAKYTLVKPFSGKGVHFKDVAGLHEAKVEVMEFVDYLKNPERYKKLGAKVPKGALLLGPPGCGKTLLAKAVATESNVPFLSMNGSEFIEVVGGVGAARVRSLFAEAKKRAPSIIYIDEIDAIGKNRSEHGQFTNSESERTLVQLLVEMDGMTTAEDIIILASTNRADVLDKALLRPGRFDRHISIELPTLEERIQIFEYHLELLSLEGKAMQYAKYLAHLTPGFTGADIANVCNEAALHAASWKKKKVDNDDLMYSIDKVLGGTVKKSSTLTPSEKKIVVYHEAGHALAAWLLEHVNPLIKVTVVPRTNKRLGFAQYSDSNLKLHTSEHLFERICVLLGGRVAENIMFNKISSRAHTDLKKVTEIAYLQVQQFGMSPSVGLLSFHKELTSTKTKKLYSKKLASLMDAEVRRIITEAYKRTEKLLQDNKNKLVTVAEELLKKETLTYSDIEALIGPPPFEKKNLSDLQYNSDVE